MTSNSSPVEGIYFSFIRANGITHRLASTVKDFTEYSQESASIRLGYPLILFLHGFPESWYSWRHQLLYLKDKPYLAVAPDMRGYGSTKQPCSVDDYTQPVLAQDVVGIAKALGYTKFLVVGHDWGSALAWSVALLFPDQVLGVAGLSVPYSGTPNAGFLMMLQAKHGKCLDDSVPREERQKATFHYVLHHCLPRAEEVYDSQCHEALYRLYAVRPGCEVEEGTPEYEANGLMFPPTGNEERVLDAMASPGWWLRLPRPKTLPEWLTKKDLDYYVSEFQRAGFSGGLRWYQAMDMNFELMKHALTGENGELLDKVRPPSLFMTGEQDNVIQMYGGKEKVIARLQASCPALTREPIFLKRCGHWIQQESPAAVNDALSNFFDTVFGIAGEGLSSKL
jgi:pimeloyl-ACP methyl ester carboxylesterase